MCQLSSKLVHDGPFCRNKKCNIIIMKKDAGNMDRYNIVFESQKIKIFRKK